MRQRNTVILVAVLISLAIFSFVAIAQQARSVDDEALLDAGRTGDEWLTYGLTWSEQRYSPLRQINTSNVAKLGLAWEVDLPRAGGNPQTKHEGTPLIHNGVVYSIAPWSVVYAVDARTGKELWHADPDVNQQIWQSRICCFVVNRGIALYENKVIAPVIDGRMRALDTATGKVVWETRVSPETQPYTITMAPRVIKGGKIIVGMAGGEYGVRGNFVAIDANTGAIVWRFYTVPGSADDPAEAEIVKNQPVLKEWAKTWSPDYGKLKLSGGGPVWGGVAYDPDADIVYVGTGQPATWTEYNRGEGDALCTNCIIAVRGATGKYLWHYQTTPGDDWDYDSVADIVLAELPIGGRTRKVLMHAPKNGFFYVLDRLTGELLSAEPWVTVNWASGIDMRTGRPVVNPEARYGTDTVTIMPGPGGGHVWAAMSYHPGTGLVYIPGTIGTSYNYQANPDFEALPIDIGPEGRGGYNMGTGRGKQQAKGAEKGKAAPPPAALPTIGPTGRGNFLSAWDPVHQTERWRAMGGSNGFGSGGTMATAGNLVFSSVDKKLMAFRADTGEVLLDLETGLTQLSAPVTFLIDGKQYIVMAGGPAQAAGAAGRGGKAGDGPPPAPSKMIALVVGGTTPLPGVAK